MNSSLIRITRSREALAQQLSTVRQASLQAARNDDFRTVARLTLEAARLNRSIAEIEVDAELAR